jgi:CTP:phosphocholine cytidylyltransferase-like protein
MDLFLYLYKQVYICKRSIHIAREILRKEQLESYRKRTEKLFKVKEYVPECNSDSPICNVLVITETPLPPSSTLYT